VANSCPRCGTLSIGGKLCEPCRVKLTDILVRQHPEKLDIEESLNPLPLPEVSE
jgi:hypothetical protein